MYAYVRLDILIKISVLQWLNALLLHGRCPLARKLQMGFGIIEFAQMHIVPDKRMNALYYAIGRQFLFTIVLRLSLLIQCMLNTILL